MSTANGKPRPRVDVDNAPYFDAASAQRFVIQRCRSCARWAFFPRNACPGCLSDDLEWVEPSGRGELVSFSVVERPHHPAFYDQVPIVFAAIRLQEGPVMLSEIRGAHPDELDLGMPLTVGFEEVDTGLTLPVWSPSAPQQA
jgi:3-oxo-4,17-pregnadiene-20-carboxyl-CoA hydratase alpha subunit